MQVLAQVFWWSSDPVDQERRGPVSFQGVPVSKEEPWGGEFWADGHYTGTISGRVDKQVIERCIEGQGRKGEIEQLKLFDI